MLANAWRLLLRKELFADIAAFFSKPELKISEDFSVEQTNLMSRLTGSHQFKLAHQ